MVCMYTAEPHLLRINMTLISLQVRRLFLLVTLQGESMVSGLRVRPDHTNTNLKGEEDAEFTISKLRQT